MKHAFISQPMNGLSDGEILKRRKEAESALKAKGYECVDSFFANIDVELAKSGVVNLPLAYLSESLTQMSKCSCALFLKGWENARGCVIEHSCAEAYGLDILYEE